MAAADAVVLGIFEFIAEVDAVVQPDATSIPDQVWPDRDAVLAAVSCEV
jgi:hypothetical protein